MSAPRGPARPPRVRTMAQLQAAGRVRRAIGEGVEIAGLVLLAALLVIAAGELGRRAPDAPDLPVLGFPDGAGAAVPFLESRLR